MAQEFDIVINALKDLKSANNVQFSNFENVLSNMSLRLERLGVDAVSIDVFKAYINDIVKSYDQKNSTIMSKFSDIEKALRTIFVNNDNLAKTADIKELYDIFTKSMNSLYSEALQQKTLITSMENRIVEIGSNKTDKEDIIRTINLLRGDFENVNRSYKEVIDTINSQINGIIGGIKNTDQTDINTEIKAQVEFIGTCVNDVINFLKNQNERTNEIERLLNTVATNDSLKLTHAIVETIEEQTSSIYNNIAEIATKEDIESLKSVSNDILDRTDDLATKEKFEKLYSRIEEITNETDSIKQFLAQVTKDVENLPDIRMLEDGLHSLFKQIEDLSDEIKNTKEEPVITDLQQNFENIITEIGTIKTIITDVGELTSANVQNEIEKISFSHEVSVIIDAIRYTSEQLPQKEDLMKILEQEIETNTSVSRLEAKTTEILNRLETLPDKGDFQEIADSSSEIKEKLYNTNIENEFDRIYQKTSDINEWLDNSNLKENSEMIVEKITNTVDKADIIKVLKATEKIVDNIEELSHNTDVKKVNRTVAELYRMLEETKNDFINTTEMHNDSIIVNLSELQNTVAELVTGEDFDNFVDDLKSLVEKLSNEYSEIIEKFEDIKKYQENILEKINNIDTTPVEELINNLQAETDTKLDLFSKNITNFIQSDMDDIKNSISEILLTITNNNTKVPETDEMLHSLENYLIDIQTLVNTRDDDFNDEIKLKLENFETNLEQYKAINEKDINNVIHKLENIDEILKPISENTNQEQLDILSDIQNRLDKIAELYEKLRTEDKQEPEVQISEFLIQKIDEIRTNIEELSGKISENVGIGFTTQAEILEEKFSILLELIKELRHQNCENFEIFEKLTISDSELIECNTAIKDIVSNIKSTQESNIEQIIEEISPIKYALQEFAQSQNSMDIESLKTSIDNLHNEALQEFKETTSLSQNYVNKAEMLYNKITEEFSLQNNEVKNTILDNADALILKIDELKSDIESVSIMDGSVNVSELSELKEFSEQIKNFQNTQQELISNAVEDIKQTISTELKETNKEAITEIKESISTGLKQQEDNINSLLPLIKNSDKIINEINKLTRLVNERTIEYSQNKDDQEFKTLNTDEFESNQFEQPFETNVNEEVLKELKADFTDIVVNIDALANDNKDIKSVLEILLSKMDNVSLISKGTGISEENVLVSSDNVEILKALEILKEEIKALKDLSNNNPAKIDNNTTNVSSDKWLAELKDYLCSGDEIKTLLNDITTKINTIQCEDNSENKEIISEIKNILLRLNIDRVNNIPEDNTEIKNVLNAINIKMDTLSNFDIVEDLQDSISEISDSINNLQQINSDTPELDSRISELQEKIEQYTEQKDTTSLDILNSISDIDSKFTKEIDKINIKIDANTTQYDDEAIANLEDTITNEFQNLNVKIDANTSQYDDEAIANLEDTITNEFQNLNVKIDANTSQYDDEAIANLEDTITNEFENLNVKIDANTSQYDDEAIANLEDTITNEFQNLNNKIDEQTKINQEIKEINSKIDILADNSSLVNEIQDTIYEISEQTDDQSLNVLNSLSSTDSKITAMLETINQKLDVLADSDSVDTVHGFDDIKSLIESQMNYIENIEHSSNTDIFKKCLSEIQNKIANALDDSSNKTGSYLKDMKNSIVEAVVTMAEQISFAEESEEIKYLVEERTDEISKNLSLVTKQLKQITNSSEDADYVYSMQDIETDLAKLRIALKEIQDKDQDSQNENITLLIDNINKVGSTVQELQNSISNEDTLGLQAKFREINSDMNSLKAITGKLLENSGEASKVLNNWVDGFGRVLTDQLSEKIEEVVKLLHKSDSSDNVMRQALIYIGEWIDSASNSINTISTNSEEFLEIKSSIDSLKKTMPEHTSILASLEEKFDNQQERLSYFEKQISKIENLENRFDEQQERIDRLEMTLGKILSVVEDLDDSKVSRKIDKIDKQLLKLSTNIEKIASYVD